MTSTVAFPNADLARSNSIISRSSRISLQSIRTTALEIHHLFYGTLDESDPPHHVPKLPPRTLEAVYEPNAVYENPWISIPNRETILNIHHFAGRATHVRVPFGGILNTLLGRPGSKPKGSLFRIWSEVSEICENESFDGTRTSMIEHTIHVQLFPGLYKTARSKKRASITPQPLPTIEGPRRTGWWWNRWGTRGPSEAKEGWDPLHAELRVITQLSFNESGRVTYHRDTVDVKDVLLLVPGFPTLQWFGSAVASHVLSNVGQMVLQVPGSDEEESGVEEEFLYTAQKKGRKRHGVERDSRGAQRAPDVDRG